MEEIITVDGRQFKLTTDRPLTVQEKTQTIAEIRKQTGCGTCGTKAVQPNTMNSQIKSMAGTCPVVPKTGGDTLNLSATAVSGVQPYNAKFYKDVTGTIAVPNRVQIGIPAGVAIATDGGTALDTYVLTDLDASSANFGGIAGDIQLIAVITDSCPSPGPQSCEQTCILSITCATPICNFTVT